MKWAVLLGLSLCILPSVWAQELTFTLDQEEYYFLVGQQAVVNLSVDNEFESDITGTLTYTIRSEVQQGGMSMTQSNTQSTPFAVSKGESAIPISFGSANTPTTLEVDFEFSFPDGVVMLNDARVHFVQDQQQQQNKQQQKQSTQQQSKQEAQLQQQMQQAQQDQTQQRLQNNQIAQDSSALKEQLEDQVQKQQQLQEEFKQTLEQNQEFLQSHQQLLNQGYQQTGASLNPESSDTGEFEIEYEHPEQGTATTKGALDKGELSSLDTTIEQDAEQAMSLAQQDTRYQQFKQELEQEGYTQQSIETQQQNNQTVVQTEFLNELNQTATITTTVANQTVEKVEVDKETNRPYWLYLILILVILGLVMYLKKISKPTADSGTQTHKVLFNYKKESKKLLNKAKKGISTKKFKQSYMYTGQALRLFLSYEHGLNKEMTNDELISALSKHLNTTHIRSDLEHCELVEFAKGTGSARQLLSIIKRVEHLIDKKI